jgi:hypothetical protein
VSYLVLVSSHALDRAFERWPGEAIGITTIRTEVLQALHEGRVSARKPPHFQNSASGRVLYTWTADGRRAHVLRATSQSFRVLTLLDQTTKAAAA